MKALFLILVLAFAISAEEVSGHLYDLFTGEALSGVQVRLGSKSTATDDDGNLGALVGKSCHSYE